MSRSAMKVGAKAPTLALVATTLRRLWSEQLGVEVAAEHANDRAQANALYARAAELSGRIYRLESHILGAQGSTVADAILQLGIVASVVELYRESEPGLDRAMAGLESALSAIELSCDVRRATVLGGFYLRRPETSEPIMQQAREASI